MCGRFVLATKPSAFVDQFTEDPEADELHLHLSAREMADIQEQVKRLEADFEPRYNVAPTTSIPAIARYKDDDVMLANFKWGLVPYWAKDESFAAKCFNARAESISEKPSFKDAFRRSRCVIFADGYYEWKPTAAKIKQPYFVHLKNSAPMFFAGVCEPKTGTAAIVTIEAQDKMRELHHRRPVFLQADEVLEWLDPKAEKGDLELMIQASQDKDIDIYPVSTIVNKVGTQGASLIEPLATLL